MLCFVVFPSMNLLPIPADDISVGQEFASSLESTDGICVSTTHLVSEVDDDSFSLSSEYGPMHSSRGQPQKLEMRIGINHFNRSVLQFIWNLQYFRTMQPISLHVDILS